MGKDGAILVFKKSENFKRSVFAYPHPKNPSGHKESLYCLDISYDGKYMITGGKDRVIKIWDLLKKREYFTLKGHSKPVHCLKFKRNSYEFYSGSADG